MPGYPNSPLVVTVSDTLANIAPTVGNVANYYVWLVNEGSGVNYGPSAATTSGGAWSIAGVPLGTYKPFYGTQPTTGVVPVRWQAEGTSPYVVAAPGNSYIPPGGFSSWSAALAKVTAGTGIATKMIVGASVANGGTAVTDIITKPYFAVGRARDRAAGYTTHGDSFLCLASSTYNPGVAAAVYPFTHDVVAASWGYYGPFQAPVWGTITTLPLFHATHPSVALGYNARSARFWYYDVVGFAGRTFHARVNADGATDQLVTILGDGLMHSIDFLNLPNQVGNVINVGNQGAASIAAIPIAMSWYPTVTIPTTGIHYSWFGVGGAWTMFDFARTDGTTPQYKIEQLIGPTATATPFVANAALSPPFAPDLCIVDIFDDMAAVNIPTVSVTTGLTINGGVPEMVQAGFKRLINTLRQKSTGCSVVFHLPNVPDGLVSDIAPSTIYKVQNAPSYNQMTKDFAETNGCGWLNTDAVWTGRGLANGYLLAGNPHPSDAGSVEIDGRFASRLGL